MKPDETDGISMMTSDRKMDAFDRLHAEVKAELEKLKTAGKFSDAVAALRSGKSTPEEVAQALQDEELITPHMAATLGDLSPENAAAWLAELAKE